MEPSDWLVNTFDPAKAEIYADAGVFAVVPESADENCERDAGGTDRVRK